MVVIQLARAEDVEVRRVAPERLEVPAAEPLVFAIDGSARKRPSMILGQVQLPISGVKARRTLQGVSGGDRLEFAVTGLRPGDHDLEFTASVDRQGVRGRVTGRIQVRAV